MLDYLDKLREKPLYVRKRIAFFTTVALSLIIASVWWNSWNAGDAASAERAASIANTTSPWSVVGDTFARAKSSTLSAFDDAMNSIKSNDLDYAAQTSDPSSGQDVDAATTLPEDTLPDTSSEEVEEGQDMHMPESTDGSAPGVMLHTRPRATDAVAATGSID